MNSVTKKWNWENSIATSKLTRLQEVTLTTLLANMPKIFFGTSFRRLLYPPIFSQFGRAIDIEPDVKFYGTANIEIGDRVKLNSGVRLNALGDKNNRISIGSGTTLERGVDLGTLENSSIVIGENTYIGLYTCITGYGNIKIGKKCLIAAHCGIYGNGHIFADSQLAIADQEVTKKGITIEDDCWLGHGVTVIDGITIARGSVIGAGAVVTRNIPPYSIAVGVPARVIAQRHTAGNNREQG
ncbi:acyltransferase [Anabaena azotica]|uniref:acyltransferase n=1 Tax=Anabaena azotica TaxID=197653 RepID=UPI0039A5C85E